MKNGNIIEYIDRQKIVCAVITDAGKPGIAGRRLRLLTENSREVKLAVSRLTHWSPQALDISSGRQKLIDAVSEISAHRDGLAGRIDIKGIWDVLNTESEWIDLETMTGFCFEEEITPDHEAAVTRAFFRSRLYFKFSQGRFFPYTPEHVEEMMRRAEQEAARARRIAAGGRWLGRMLALEDGAVPSPEDLEETEFIHALSSYYLFEKDSDTADLARAIMDQAGMKRPEQIFDLLVRIGIWSPDEDVDILRMEIPVEFPKAARDAALAVLNALPVSPGGIRRDLTGLHALTIDGQATQDFDDALSLEFRGDERILGIHIADVGQVVAPDGALDREALRRGSSIYLPDRKIPMLPPDLSENLCSLRAENPRPAISTMIRLSGDGAVLGYEIFPSMIRVAEQLTYYDANTLMEEREDLAGMYEIAVQFRQKRLDDGAIHISLPEINLWLDEDGRPALSRTNRESPARMLVAEIMILANWTAARFLVEQGLPAVFRSQPAPKDRLYKRDEGSLFQNWMQRKYLNRFVLSPSPESHSGLGLNAYVTATSPIRKYFDLLTQRQLRAAFDLNSACAEAGISACISRLEDAVRQVGRLQARRKRYWLLRYLEGCVGQKEEAIVLNKFRREYAILLPEYMLECRVPAAPGMNFKPEDMVRVIIQQVNAREDRISVYPG